MEDLEGQRNRSSAGREIQGRDLDVGSRTAKKGATMSEGRSQKG
jgi:hypothetical protein